MLESLAQENIEEALDFAEISHKDSAWKDYPFDREFLRKNLEKMIDSQNHFTCIYRRDGKIAGYWFAALCQLLCSKRLRGEENGIYILPEYRGGKVAWAMYIKYYEWCEKNEAEPVSSVQFGDEESNQKAYSFFKSLGMIECGRIFRGGNNGLR